MWPEPAGKMNHALVRVKNILTCRWLRYDPQDDEEVIYDGLLRRNNNRNSVNSVIARYEQSIKSSSQDQTVLLNNNNGSSRDGNNRETTCFQKVCSRASSLCRLVGPEKSKSNTNLKPLSIPEPVCRVCQGKIFPLQHDSVTARNQQYHISCFKCSQCGCRLKNHPEEDHQVAGYQQPYLHCHLCKLDRQHQDKPKLYSRIAGERIVVADEEQGDIEQVVDAIGDELEDVMYGMIPRCATCGGDFLQYKGEISILGSLKYHRECFLMGRPAMGLTPSMTLQPIQAAKYLPENIILRIAQAESGKSVTSLFFVWKDKEASLKSMRAERNTRLSVSFQLDESAHANPNYRGDGNNATTRRKRNTKVKLPPTNETALRVDLVGADDIAPNRPEFLGVTSEPAKVNDDSSHWLFKGVVRYSKYSLRHSVILTIPFSDANCDALELLGAAVTVEIEKE